MSSCEWWRHINLTISSFNVLIPLKRNCLRDRLQFFQKKCRKFNLKSNKTLDSNLGGKIKCFVSRAAIMNRNLLKVVFTQNSGQYSFLFSSLENRKDRKTRLENRIWKTLNWFFSKDYVGVTYPHPPLFCYARKKSKGQKIATQGKL